MNEQYKRLKRLINKYSVEDAELEEKGEAAVLTYNGNRLLFDRHSLMSVDHMQREFETTEMLRLPEFSYEVLVWLAERGYTNDKFKFVPQLPYCYLCREQYNKVIHACYLATIPDGMQPVCPEHAESYQVQYILIERQENVGSDL